MSWIARLGAVEVGHVIRRFGVGRSVAYDLVARSVEVGLLERVELLRGEPSLIRSTEDGIELSGLGLAVAKLRAGQLHHWIACADVALWAERQWGADSLISERELRFAEHQPASRSQARRWASFPVAGRCFTAPTWS